MSADSPRVRLGDVLELQRRWVKVEATETYHEIGVRSFGNGIFHKPAISGLTLGGKRVLAIHPGDLVLNNVFAWEGAVAVAGPEEVNKIGSHRFVTATPVSGRCETSYLRWFFVTESGLEVLRKASPGSAGRNRTLNLDQFFASEIPLPPLPEQRRIVERVEAVASRIAEAKRLREEASAEVIALSRAESRAIFEDADAGEGVTLETVCAEIIDNLHSNPVYAESGVPCVRSPDVGWGTLNLATALTTSEEEYQRRTVRGEPAPDDIVLVREGGGTGKAALVEPGQRFSLGQRVMMLRPDKGKVVPKFLLHQLLSPVIYDDHILPLSTGSASPHLNIGALRKFPIRLPALPEQRRIVAHLDALQAKADALRALQSETATELDALLPSVLNRAFAGEL